MAKQPTKPTPPLAIWDVYKAAAKAKPLGTVEAADADEALRVTLRSPAGRRP